MKIEQFITLSDKDRKKIDLTVGDNVVITKEGLLLFNMDRNVPVIVRGVGCIGTAKIISVTLMATGNTKIDFELLSMSSKSKEAAYIVWQNTNSSSSDDNDEHYIPGVYRARTEDLDETPRKVSRRELPDFLQ